jgi:hypothetical protein
MGAPRLHEIEKGSQKERDKGWWIKGAPAGGFTVALFGTLFRAIFFRFPAELHVRPRFCRFSTLFVLLIERGGKDWAKNEENGKKSEKKSNCEQPY